MERGLAPGAEWSTARRACRCRGFRQHAWHGLHLRREDKSCDKNHVLTSFNPAILTGQDMLHWKTHHTYPDLIQDIHDAARFPIPRTESAVAMHSMPGRESSFMGSDGRTIVSCAGYLFGGAFPLKITIMNKFTAESAFALSDVWHFQCQTTADGESAVQWELLQKSEELKIDCSEGNRAVELGVMRLSDEVDKFMCQYGSSASVLVADQLAWPPGRRSHAAWSSPCRWSQPPPRTIYHGF